MPKLSYATRRGQIETYFDKTAVDAWTQLTSDAPVSKIRATVRAGRERMRSTLLDWLPSNLNGKRILDAGCGTGMLAIKAAQRGADVTAVDLSPNLIDIASQRTPKDLGAGRITFIAGDFMDETLGKFDYMVAMDSLIHYPARDAVRLLAELNNRTRNALLFTFAPKTPALAVMHTVGRLFPRKDRAPAIEPVGETALRKRIAKETGLKSKTVERTRRISQGFYMSQAMELRAA